MFKNIYKYSCDKKILNLLNNYYNDNILVSIIFYNDFINKLNNINNNKYYKYSILQKKYLNLIRIESLYDHIIFNYERKEKTFVFLKHFLKLRNINNLLLTFCWKRCLQQRLENNIDNIKCYYIIINHNLRQDVLTELCEYIQNKKKYNSDIHLNI